MPFDFTRLKFHAAAVPLVLPVPEPTEPKPEVTGERLDDETVVEMWNERSAIQETDNVELIRWHRNNGKSDSELRRACELCAAADLSMQLGTYVEAILRPLLAQP